MTQVDLLIRGGLVVDGTGSEPIRADVAVTDGRIVEVAPDISTSAYEVLDADGHIVTPGWIDVHTHFDGQATWDDKLEPSFGHGVTTVVMGNCGVGFAPVRPRGEDKLIDIMEGVEDIPGTALHDGIPWGEWETYPEYLRFLRARSYAMDIGSNIAHGALRAYVLDSDDTYAEVATPAQIGLMAKMVEEAMRAGAMGLSVNRICAHRSVTGEEVPGTFASEAELMSLVRAMGCRSTGVLQLIPGGAMGHVEGIREDAHTGSEEVAMMARLSRACGRPVTYTLYQLPKDPEGWRTILGQSEWENTRGAQLFPQISARPPGVLMSLGGYHPFQRRETYLKLCHLPFSELVREMSKADVKDAILNDQDVRDPLPGSMQNFMTDFVRRVIGRLFPLGTIPNYEPEFEQTVAGVARATAQSEQSVLYDMLMQYDGKNVVMLADTNYAYHNLDAVREMFLSPSTVSALSDAGAHVKFICDASIPTYTLCHFVRDRTRGPRISIEASVAKLSAASADLYGLGDRGRLLPGKRADINVIDLDRLGLELPRMHYDLPRRAGRMLQAAHGYRATFVKGVMTRMNDGDTGQRPGRLLDGGMHTA